MGLRTKLILILTSIVIVVALASSTLLYLFASSRLEQRAKQRLMGTAVLLTETIQLRFNTELRKFEHWASMPLVINTALDYQNPKTLAAFDKYFSAVVAREPYHSVYLIDRNGDCIASDDPLRVYQPHCRKFVSKRPSAVAGFAGIASIGRTILSVAGDRPVATLTAPIRHQGEVVAILRAGVDMGRFSQEILKPHALEPKEEIYFFDPSMPSAPPGTLKLPSPTNWVQYSPPPKELRTAFEKRSQDIFRYRDSQGEYLVAFAQLSAPPWIIMVSQPMANIIAPVRLLGKITLVLVILTIVLLIASIFLITAPVVRRIERCREFSEDICRGLLERRLRPGSRDEVGDLARDLNEMAARLEKNYRDLEEAERKYRGIFENSVEGIFQTNGDGIMLAVNPRLAEILGAPRAEVLVGKSAGSFYADRGVRERFLNRLRLEGEVGGFECEMIRMDGERLQAVLHARVELNAQGEIEVIHGSLEDVTELRSMEAKASRARQAEDLLLRTELEMLRYQVNPHFLFNNLNSLRELVLAGSSDGVEMIEALADFYHSCLVHRFEPFSTISEEFGRIERYLQIQKIRFRAQLVTTMEMEASAEQVRIPVFIVQPMVENAIKYGRRSGTKPLQVRISAELEGPQCLVTVANTGRWFAPDQNGYKQGTQLGLEYVQRCLAHHYGSNATLEIKQEGGWVLVRVIFPVRREAGDE